LTNENAQTIVELCKVDDPLLLNWLRRVNILRRKFWNSFRAPLRYSSAIEPFCRDSKRLQLLKMGWGLLTKKNGSSTAALVFAGG
jgi:hypothetical protein